MFFRRERKKVPTFAERLEAAKSAGFTVVAEGGLVRVTRDGVTALLEDAGGVPRVVARAGLVMCGETGDLVDGGFQKFFQTPSGKRKPALAGELKSIHDFQEDLREALGLESLYNESLGTVSTFYQYDRLKDRDRGVPKRPWE
jgi:hypothetical protein